MKSATVSVVMSVYNGAQFLREAIDSILGQSLTDFELIIVNDGSTDDSESIIESYKDPRIKLISQANQGLVTSLNTAIERAASQYIARHDADDKSDPERLEKQLAVLKSRPEVVLVGSSISVMNENSQRLHEHRLLLGDPEIKEELLVRSPFAHGSVVFRKEAFDKISGYRTDEWPAEDYGLWLRLAAYGRMANLDEPLYVYREHDSGISTQKEHEQLQRRDQIRVKAWRQRRELLAEPIDTSAYPALIMGQFRVERITDNLLFAWHKSLKTGHWLMALKILKQLLADRGLRRKCARLVAVRLRIKHA